MPIGPLQISNRPQVTKEEMKGINLQPDRFHGEWNYVIRPH